MVEYKSFIGTGRRSYNSSQAKYPIGVRSHPILVFFLASADVNPIAWLFRLPRKLKLLSGQQLVVVEQARDDLVSKGWYK